MSSYAASVSDPQGQSVRTPLSALLGRVASVVNSCFTTQEWVVAELSEMRESAVGHCYLQLIEKNETNGVLVASVRGMVWANRWPAVRERFYAHTGTPLAVGMKVLLLVEVRMHVCYGMSLTVVDIDPTYTLGEMAARRLQILRQLQADGVVDMNRQLPLPMLVQRIAVVSAEGAAGWGDFRHQLAHNAYGLQFYLRLFPALMQGDQTEATVIHALETIAQHSDCFDLVVIIRGGGAVADLASFDSYALASTVANFPLPVVVGIGHERDNTVLDHVAFLSVKTPTAAAAWLIERLAERLQAVEQQASLVREAVRTRLDQEQRRLQRAVERVREPHTRLQRQLTSLDGLTERFRLLFRTRLSAERATLARTMSVLPTVVRRRVAAEQVALARTSESLPVTVRRRLTAEEQRLHYCTLHVQAVQPDTILRRGFSIVRLQGKALHDAQGLTPGQDLDIETAHGSFTATVKQS